MIRPFIRKHPEMIPLVTALGLLVSIFRRPPELGYQMDGLPKSHQEDIYGQTKGAKHRQHFTHTRRKWWLEKIRPFIRKPSRDDAAYDGLRPYLLLPLQPYTAVTL